MPTRIAMDTQKSMREGPALEIGADLSLDESGDGGALPSRASQEGLEFIANDFNGEVSFRVRGVRIG